MQSLFKFITSQMYLASYLIPTGVSWRILVPLKFFFLKSQGRSPLQRSISAPSISPRSSERNLIQPFRNDPAMREASSPKSLHRLANTVFVIGRVAARRLKSRRPRVRRQDGHADLQENAFKTVNDC